MRKQEVIDKTIRLIGCDTARIVSVNHEHYMIIGYNANTRDDLGHWERNGEPFDFDYTKEKVIASGHSMRTLWDDVQFYHKICSREVLSDYIQKGERISGSQTDST